MARPKKVRKLSEAELHYIRSFCHEKTLEQIATSLCLETKDIKEVYNNLKSKPKTKFDRPAEGVVSMTGTQSMDDDESSKMQQPSKTLFETRLANCIFRRDE